MEFFYVIRVHPDRTVSYVPDRDVPTVYQEEGDGTWPIDDESLRAAGWQLMDGYSRQDRYSGPWMHQSEFIGGGMADDILATPGLYAAIYPTMLGDPDDDEQPDAETWAVAYIHDEEGGST